MRRETFDEDAVQAPLPNIPGKRITQVRRNYCCAADGCPNTATIDDRGIDHPGRCYWHWVAAARDWPSVTAKILASPSMRNHGNVPTERSRAVLDLQNASRNSPRGMRNMSTGGEL